PSDAGLIEGADDICVGAAQALAPHAVAIAAPVILDRFVDHVPADDLAAPAPGDLGDVAVVFGDEARSVVDEGGEPRMLLRVPDQGVAEEADAQITDRKSTR